MVRNKNSGIDDDPEIWLRKDAVEQDEQADDLESGGSSSYDRLMITSNATNHDEDEGPVSLRPSDFES